ncbi:MAG: hypothetical protein ACOX9R_16635 [Armatimonadota bacterium]|jgi:hypothetical protein
MMRKLIIGMMLLALCGTLASAQNIEPLQNNTHDGDPATAYIEVGVSVEAYAEVRWNQPSAGFSDDWGEGGDATVDDLSLSLLGPVGWVLGENQLEIPLRVRSNASVMLTLHEGLTETLTGAGVPAAHLWNTPEYRAQGDEAYLVYKSEIALLKDRAQYSSASFDPKWADATLGEGWWTALPDATGNGVTSGLPLMYGENFAGDFEAFVLIGTQTHENTSGDWDWTQLDTGSLGTVKYYATIQAYEEIQ